MRVQFLRGLTGFNITESKESNANVSVYSPLLGFTVRAAAVVHKARRVSFWAGVYHTILRANVKSFQNAPWCLLEAIFHCLSVSLQRYLGEGEHVEVGHVIFMGTFDSLLALLRVYHLSHVLLHKVTLDNKTNIFYIVLSITQEPIIKKKKDLGILCN